MTDRAKHLVGVWNPAYAADAMSATVALLLARAREFRQALIAEDEVYVWWGKVKSSNRQQPLPHLKDILAMDAALSNDEGVGPEVHFYLTDYRSLYVAHVAEVTSDDITVDEDQRDHVPSYYHERALVCEVWFKLFDIRRLVADDTVGVVEELRKLRNTRYNDRPVSIYGGMVDLPLIVTREDVARYFEADVRKKLIDARFWVEFDAEQTGVGEMERDLRDNVVGAAAWNELDPAARSFIASAESVFRARRRDAAFDFSGVVVNFSKAIELQTNSMLRRALSGVRLHDRRANVDGRSVDLANGELWSLGTLARVMSQEEHVNRALKRRLVNGDWFAVSLPPFLAELADLRNPAAHSEGVSADAAGRIRDRVLGVGERSILDELAQTRVR